MFATVANAQTSDKVITDGGSKETYYKLSNGLSQWYTTGSWHLAFTTNLIDASILSNDQGGVEVYLASENAADWASLDSSKISSDRIYNSETSWAEGALSNLGTSHPDYGWGTYNQTTHNINGSRIFVVKLPNGTRKKLFIEKMETSGNVSFKLADLNGQNEITATYNKNDYKLRNFVQYNILTNTFTAYEPQSSEWELLFTKYYSMVSPGTYYPVSGVKINKNIQIAQRDGYAVTSNDTSMLVYGTDISEIGSDWKSFNMTTNSYNIVQDRAYFLKLKSGEIWKVYFTGYAGGSSGAYDFTKEWINGTAGITNEANNATVYPNPASNQLHILYEFNNKPHTVKIINSQGSIVLMKTILANGFTDVNLQISELGRGFYTTEISDGNTVVRNKFVKN